MTEMLVQVESGIIHPHRSSQFKGYRPDALAIPGDQVQFELDQPPQILERR